jgi:hypothetical protein
MPKILKMSRRHELRTPEKSVEPASSTKPELSGEIIEFPNDPAAQPDDATVKRWLNLADEMLNDSERKHA